MNVCLYVMAWSVIHTRTYTYMLVYLFVWPHPVLKTEVSLSYDNGLAQGISDKELINSFMGVRGSDVASSPYPTI